MSDELLGFAQGKVNLKPRATSIGRLLKLLDQEILNDVRTSPVRVLLSTEDVGQLILDEARLTRCFANIIKNAKEALGEEGTITIQILNAGSKIKVSISDNGPGIPELIRGRIFEPFVTHGKKRGTGLGMAIAKSTVDAHGGRIWLESETGKGTTFHVEVPKQVDLSFTLSPSERENLTSQSACEIFALFDFWKDRRGISKLMTRRQASPLEG